MKAPLIIGGFTFVVAKYVFSSSTGMAVTAALGVGWLANYLVKATPTSPAILSQAAPPPGAAYGTINQNITNPATS